MLCDSRGPFPGGYYSTGATRRSDANLCRRIGIGRASMRRRISKHTSASARIP